VKPLKELKKGSAIFVTGTPGTGKTVVSRTLAKAIRARYLNPAELLKREHTKLKYDRKRRTRIVSPGTLRNAVASQAKRIDQGLVIDSHIIFEPPSSVRIERVFVLRCRPDLLEERLKQKQWTRQKIRENSLAEILDICLWDAVENYGRRRVSEIDTTGMRPRAVVELALRQLNTRRARTQHRVDWLSTLENEGKLDGYVA
jgi:adenylate kinase